jgi:hypothetical protein
MAKVSILAGLAIGCLAVPSAFGHHGTGINYDTSKAITLRAVVTEFRFAQPHPQIFLDVKDEKGNIVNWGCEIGPNVPWLIREGWTKRRSEDALRPGTPLTVTLTPARSGRPVGLINRIVNDNGETILPPFGNPGGQRGAQ